MKKLLFLTLLLSAIGMKGWAEQYPNKLYAVGGAISTGWGGPIPATGSPLYKYSATVNETSHTIYQGFVKFSGNENDELKFMCQDNEWTEHWGAEGTVISNGDNQYDIHYYNDGDHKFKLGSPKPSGVYLVTIDATSGTVSFQTWNSSDYYEIGNAAQLSAFANCVNNTFETSINAKLTADVNWGTTTIMIGGNASDDSDFAQAYKGTFDGQGYTLTYSLSRTEDYAALFKNLDGATIQNLRVAGSVTHHINKSKYTASIFGKAYNSTVVKNCVSTVTLTNYTNEDATMGGIGALMYDLGSKIENCAFLGTMNGDYDSGKPYGVGGILGWAGDANVVVENCYVNGTIDVANNNTNIVIVRSNDITPTNCYYLNNGNLNSQNGATLVTSAQVTSGELCYLLNGSSSDNPVWYQTLGTDNYPVPFGTGHKVVYYNTDFYANVGKDSQDGYFVIANADDLEAFAYTVNNGHTTINGKLTADIDMTGHSSFPGIGTSSNRFHGIFDGQKHIISNLNMNITDNGVGFFRYVTGGTNGTTIKRFTIDSSCSFQGNDGVGAFVGRAQGEGNLLLEELGNEANVIGNKNAAGILGVDWENNVSIIMNNCYNTARIESTAAQNPDGGALSGWMGSKARVTNCYNIGEMVGGDNFARGTQIKVKNCYATNTTWAEATIDNESFDAISPTSVDKFSDGTVFAKLYAYNQNSVDGSVWRMDFAATTPHPVLYGNSIAMREDCQNRMVAGTYDVKLYRTLVSGSWNTICLPFDLDAESISSVFGSGTKVAAFTSANGDNLHFDLVTSISAKKPYLIYPHDNRDINTPIVLSGITIQVNPETVNYDPFNFIGIYTPTAIDGKYFVAAGNTIKKSTGGSLKGFRAYIEDTTPNAARILTLDFNDGETTGVVTMEDVRGKMSDKWNTLDGRKLDKKPTSKGLYIVNGKKVVVK